MNNRLQQFLAAENISQSQFADSIGVARASISHILKPGFDFIESMARRYPSLNLEWLITGNGRMYNTDGSDLTEDDEQPGALKTKEIDKIVVFFTDGTFAEYK